MVNLSAWSDCKVRDYCLPLCAELITGLESTLYPQVCSRVDDADAGAVDYFDHRDAGLSDASPTDANDAGALDANDDPSIVVKLGLAPYCVGGRRPAGFATRQAGARGTAAGRALARAAALEAASVPAFRLLARELEAHGAPAWLVRAARAAVAEEARHYALLSRAARARGARSVPIRVRATPVRSLVQIARENAREGCVRETLGALVADHQARHAADPSVREAMRLIARDETDHARLAWEVEAWARSVLSPRQARGVESARRAEGRALVSAAERARMPAALVRELGFPDDAANLRLTSASNRELWSV